MGWWEESKRLEAELVAAIAQFMMAWAKMEQTLHRTNQDLAVTDRYYNVAYGTEFEGLEEWTVVESRQFVEDLKIFRKVGKIAIPSQSKKVNSICKRALAAYSCRNDLGHRFTHITVWRDKTPLVWCAQNPRRKLEGQARYIFPTYPLERLVALREDVSQIEFELNMFVIDHIAHVKNKNDLTHEKIEQMDHGGLVPINNRRDGAP